MRLKPHGLEQKYATQFNDDSIMAAHETHPPYPAELMSLILHHAGTSNPHTLDAWLRNWRTPTTASVADAAIAQSERMIA
jgi:hypothetical protein